MKMKEYEKLFFTIYKLLAPKELQIYNIFFKYTNRYKILNFL